MNNKQNTHGGHTIKIYTQTTRRRAFNKTTMKKQSTITATLRLAAIFLCSLLGLGELSAQQTGVSNFATNYPEKKVSFTVSWTAAPHNNQIWVIVDYIKVENASTAGSSWQRAEITSITGSGAAKVPGNNHGFRVNTSGASGSMNVTAQLNLPAGTDQFNWCAYALDMPPTAALITAGGYNLKGSPPFIVNGATLGAGVTTFGPGTCITSLTDATGNPDYILPELPRITSVYSTTICYNTSANLTTTASGGTTTAMTYTWNIGGVSSTTTAPNKATGNIAATTTYTVTARNANGCTSAVSAVGTITVRPEFKAGTISSAGQAICYNEAPNAITSTAAATGGDNSISYQWRCNSSETITSANGAAYTPSTYNTIVGTHTFTRWAKDGTCKNWTQSAGSYVLVVRSTFNPGAITAGASTICYNGTPAAITSASDASGGDNTFIYQWKHDGLDISGATGTAYTPTTYKTAPGTHAFTRFAKDNSCGAWQQSTGSYVLTVASPFTQPVPGTTATCYNKTATINLGAATGSYGTITYQWQQSTTGNGGWSTAAGSSTGQNYTTGNLTTTMYYRRIARSVGCGEITSDNATVTVYPNFTQTDPAGTTVCNGTGYTINLGVATGGTGGITYRWEQSTNGTSWSTAAGATSSTQNYTTGNLTTTTIYHRVAMNACGTITSGNATVTVRQAFTPGTITSGNSTICYNGSPAAITNATAASGGDNAIVYEWRRGTASVGNNATAYTPSASSNTPGTHTFTRWAHDGTCNTGWLQSAGSYVLTVRPQFTPGSITSGSSTICYGATAPNITNATAASGGNGVFTYEWRYTGSVITSATANAYTPTAFNTVPGTYTFTRWVKDGECSATSIQSAGSYVLVVRPQFTPGTITSGNSTICYGTAAPNITNATAASGGDNAIVYEWRRGATSLGNNATAYTPTSSSTISGTHTFTRWAHDGTCNTGWVQSAGSYVLTVRPQFTPGAIATSGQTICSGNTPAMISSSTNASGGNGAIVYEWRYDGSVIATATAATYTPTAYNTAQGAHTFTRWAKDGACNLTLAQSAGSYVLTVRAAFNPGSIVAGSSTICYNATPAAIANSANASGGEAPIEYKWQHDGLDIASSNANSYTPTSYKTIDGAHTFTRFAKDKSCGAWAQSTGQHVLTVAASFTQGNPGNTAVCYGKAATFTLAAATGGSGGITYRWESSASSASGFGAAAGTNANANYTSATLSTNTYFRRVATNTCGTLTSSAALVTVYANVTTPHPAAQTICYSTAATISLAAATGGTGGFTYRWESSTSSSSGFAAAAGTNNNANYTSGNLTANLYFRRVAMNSCATVTSNAALVTVRPNFTPGTIAGTGQTICAGGTTNVIGSTTPASGGDGTITYEWRRNGVKIDGATAATYNPSAHASTAGAQTFTRWAHDGTCNKSFVQSTNAWVLTVIAKPATPANPAQNGPKCVGTGVVFTSATVANATGYEWNGFTSGSGTSKTTPTTANTYQARTRAYTTINGVTCAGDYSGYTTATVAGSFTQGDPAATAICYNKTATLTLAAATGGTGGTTYRWESSASSASGFAAAAGTNTSANYTTAALATTTYFRRVAMNACGTITSAAAKVTVHPNFTQPNPSAVTICRSTAATFSLAAASGGTGTITYRWEQSANNSTWTTATGTSNAAAYTTPALTGSMYYHRVAMNTCGTITTSNVFVTVRPAFNTGTIASGASTICYGAAAPNIASSAAASGGDGNITYEWRRNSTAIGSTNNAAYTPTQNTTPGAATFTRWAKDGTCNAFTQSAGSYVLTVAGSFTQGNPADVTICYGKSTGIPLAAPTGGKGNLSYNWQQSPNGNDSWANAAGTRNGVNYNTGGITTTTWYRRQAINDCGTITSTGAKVTVLTNFTAGSIATTGQTICSAAAVNTITSSGAASGGSGTISYQWQRNGSNISGATAATYAPTAYNATTGAGTFTRLAKDSGCSTTPVQSTGQWVLNVIAIPATPARPTSNSPQCSGTAVTFSAATVSGASGYDWAGNVSSTGTTRASSTSPGTYTARARAYTTLNSVTCYSAYSPDATGIVLPTFSTGSIATTGQTICSGAAVNTIGNSAAASGGNGSITYEWRRNGTPISGATATTYAPTAYNTSGGTFTRWAKDGKCNTTLAQSTGQWVLTIASAMTTPSPAATSICYNKTTAFNLGAASGGKGNITYQWQSSTDNSTWTNLSGATSAAYTTGALTGDTWFRRVATSDCGSINSSAAKVTVYANFTQPNPNAVTICNNTTTTLSPAAATGGNGNITYQWQSSTNGNDWTNVSGATSAAYTTPALTGNMYYRRQATNACGTISSNAALVTVRAKPGTPASGPTQNGPQCAGTGITFTSATVSGATGYDWNGSVTGTGASRTSSTVSGTYQARSRAAVTASGLTCYGDWSAYTSGTVIPKPATPTITQNGPVCEGSAVTFTASAVTGATAYKWNVGGSGSARTYATPTSPNTYTLSVRAITTVGGKSCEGDQAAAVSGIVIKKPTGQPAVTSNSPQCEGSAITFTATQPADADGIVWRSTHNPELDVKSGLSLTSGTASGTYIVRAAAYTTVGTMRCIGYNESNMVEGIIYTKPTMTLASGNSAQTVTVNTPISKIVYNTTGNLTGGLFDHGGADGITYNRIGSNIELTGSPRIVGTFVYGVGADNEACAVTASGTITVVAAPVLPPGAGTKTYTCGSQVWSEPVRVSACDKTSFNSSNTTPECRSNTWNGIKYYFYNGAYVKANAATLCPSPWHVPSNDEFSTLITTLGATGANGKYYPESSTWGGALAGYANGSSMVGVGSDGDYWSSTEVNDGGYYMSVGTSSVHTYNGSHRMGGLQLRCVKTN
jgi:uncharacterized protein (TIGR02145 family)